MNRICRRADIGAAGSMLRTLTGLVLAVLAMLLFAVPAQAASCNYATAQGSTGPANWQTYCWLDLSSYNDTTARSTGGQNFSYNLPDGSTMSFNLRITGAAVNAATSPSWTGAAVGNTAFTGIAGRPILYQTAAGTTTATFRSIAITPPAGASTGAFMFVAADGESSNDGESLSFLTNGANWQLLDTVGPISGASYPAYTGIGTSTFTETGAPGTVGAYIVGSNAPTQVTTTLVGGGLQGAMFAVRFASIRLNLQITGARANPADQFKFDVAATSGGAILATGTSTGTGLGPFNAAALASASSIALTLQQSMAAGSVSTLSHYRPVLTCTNSVTSSTVMPTNVVTTSYSFGSLQFGDIVQCVFTDTPFPHLTLTKALGAGGRQYNTDQFTMNISQGAALLGTTTTTGTAATLTTASTPQVQVAAATAYTLAEAAAGSTVLAQYTSGMACTNLFSGSSTALPTTPGATITPQMGDVVSCTITNTKLNANATLTIAKSSVPVSDPVNGATLPMLIPGAVVRYTLSVSNVGPTAVDANTVVLIDTLPAQIEVGTAAGPIFIQGSSTSGLTFTAGTDIRYSNAAVAPTSFAACTYTPTAAYDPAVRYVCLNPKGTMLGSTGSPPSFTLSLQGRIK
jgi:uncharacterized repeat protein (TIGR01451 family)